jgi:haloacetate dehalogenase
VADDVRGCALPAGHYLPEEVPDLVCEELERFLE